MLNPRRSHTRRRYSYPFTATTAGAKPLGYARATRFLASRRARPEYRSRFREVVSELVDQAERSGAPEGLLIALKRAL